MPVENKLDMLPESFLNSMEIMTLVENKIHPTEEQHKRLAKYLLIGLTNVAILFYGSHLGAILSGRI